MIGLDTNVLVRYLLGDERLQCEAAVRLIDEECTEAAPGFIGSIVMAELWWVLRRGVKLSHAEAGATIRGLLDNSHLRVQRAEAIIAALETCSRTQADFADCLIVLDNREAGASPTVSFDRGALQAGIMSPVPSTYRLP